MLSATKQWMQKWLHRRACYLVGHVTREVAIWGILEMTNVSRRMICDIHFTVVIDPQPTNDNVVNSCCYFTPRIVAATSREDEMSNACISTRALYSTFWQMKNNTQKHNCNTHLWTMELPLLSLTLYVVRWVLQKLIGTFDDKLDWTVQTYYHYHQ